MNIEEIAAGLTKAQRRVVVDATYRERNGAWHPEGWYVFADRRVRLNLCHRGLIRDYLNRSNQLTPLGLQVRDHIINGGTDV